MTNRVNREISHTQLPAADVLQAGHPDHQPFELHIRVRNPDNTIAQNYPIPQAAGEVALGGAEIDISLPMGEGLREQLLAVIDNHLLENHFERRANTFKLSDRERQVAKLIAQGCESSQIAERLHISVGTVNGHVAKLIGKTNGSNRAGVVGRLYGPPF